LYEGIEESFHKSGHPRDLVIVHAAGQSNRKIGFEHFAVEGLAKRIVGSHWGLMPRMSAFLGEGLAEAVCLPQGQLSSLYRAIAAGRPGNLTRIGLGTFVDPRIEAGKVNQPARDRAPDPERQHRQTDGTFFDQVYISASSDSKLPEAPFSSRLVIGRRAIRFLHQGDVVNIGTGIPGDTVGPALAEAGLSEAITLTVE